MLSYIVNVVNRNLVKKIIKNKYFLIPFILGALILLCLSTFFLYFQNRIYYDVYILDFPLGGLTSEQANNYLAGNVYPPDKITLKAKEQIFEIPLKEIDFSYDFENTAGKALQTGHSGHLAANTLMLIASPFTKTKINLLYNFNSEKLENYISVIAGQVAIEPIYPSVSLTDQGVVVEKGRGGKDINRQKLIKDIENTFALGDFTPIEVALIDTDPTIGDNDAKLLRESAESLVGKKIILKLEFDEYPIPDKEIVEFLSPYVRYQESPIDRFIDNLSEKVNRDPQNAVFVFDEGKAKEFAPAKDGLTVQKASLKEEINNALSTLQSNPDQKVATIEMPVAKVPPNITIKDVNNLGIRELVGRGVSKFAHSIPSRIYNISLASSKFNGVLVEPGETFSFNDTLGDVSSYTGYKQAYVIRDGKTVLGDGGGVCQVSTTLFRAVLNAGLPVVERRAHSYRVGYYEQDSPPGLDATVFSPTTDFKFKNDSPGHILIQTKVDTKNSTLVFEIYGTSDGRKSSITKPVVSGVSSPPEDLYIDDPTLPIGTVKQIDYKAWGAKVTFNYTVEKEGAVIYEKTFISNYLSWQAKFLRGTAPVN